MAVDFLISAQNLNREKLLKKREFKELDQYLTVKISESELALLFLICSTRHILSSMRNSGRRESLSSLING
jgi:hypothetical protein